MKYDLEQKAEQLLKVREVKDFYDRVIEEVDRSNDKAVLPPQLFMVLVVKDIIAKGVEEPETRALKKELEALGTEIYHMKAKEGRKLFDNLVSRILDTGLQLHEEGRLKINWAADPAAEEVISGFISIPNNSLYYNFRENISQGNYIIEPGQWPEADLSGGGLVGKAIVKPDISPVIKNEALAELQETMKEKVLDLSKHGDLAADIFDIITAKWLREAKSETDMIVITADDILKARGLKQQKSGSGRRGGYKEEWREAVQQQIDNLSYQWITIREMEVYKVEKGKKKAEPVKIRDEGRALSMERRIGQVKLDGSLDAFAWQLKPGAVFSKYLYDGPGRQTALLSQRALSYNPYREKLEKRLVRYLAWIWRIDEGRTRKGLLVKTLLDKIGEQVNESRPGRTKDKLEKALNRLKEKKDITAWEYENKIKTNKKGWLQGWLDSKVIITAPEVITEYYRQIERVKGNQRKK